MNEKIDIMPDYHSLLADLETPLHNLKQMASIADALWDDIYTGYDTKGCYRILTFTPEQSERFSFAICDVLNRIDALHAQWSEARDGKETANV